MGRCWLQVSCRLSQIKPVHAMHTERVSCCRQIFLQMNTCVSWQWEQLHCVHILKEQLKLALKAGRQATVTKPLSQQIHKAHTGSRARSRPGGYGEAATAAEGKPGMPRQFAHSHSVSLSRSRSYCYYLSPSPSPPPTLTLYLLLPLGKFGLR